MVKDKIQQWFLSELEKDYICAFRSSGTELIIWADREKTPAVLYPPVPVTFIDATTVQIEPVDIFPVEVRDEWVYNSLEKARRLGELNASIRKGSGNFMGYLGEYVFAGATGYKIVSDMTYHYDIFTPHFDIDVKTKECSGVPEDYYACSVKEPEPDKNGRKRYQNCSIYSFVRCKQKNGCESWILGYMFRDEFLQKAFRGELGQSEDTSGGNRDVFTYRADCLNILVKDLRKFKLVTDSTGKKVLAF